MYLIFLMMVILVVIIAYRKYKDVQLKMQYFDIKGVVNIKTKFRKQILMQSKPLTEILIDLSKQFKGSK